MSWIGNESECYKYATEKEVQEEYYETLCNEIPSGFADECTLLFLGTVHSIEEAKKAIAEAWGHGYGRARLHSGMAYVCVETKGVPKTTQEIAKRKANEEKKLMEYVAKNNCYDRKSATIGCKGCGSSLSTKHMAMKKLNKCPLCGAELRNDTVLKTIQNYQANIKKYDKQYNEALGKARGKEVFYYASEHFYVG